MLSDADSWGQIAGEVLPAKSYQAFAPNFTRAPRPPVHKFTKPATCSPFGAPNIFIWLVVSNIFCSISYMGCHPSHWRTPSLFKMVIAPPSRYNIILNYIPIPRPPKYSLKLCLIILVLVILPIIYHYIPIPLYTSTMDPIRLYKRFPHAQVWPAALCGLDIMGIAPTGSGISG